MINNKNITNKEVLLMNIITQEARKKHAIVKYAEENGNPKRKAESAEDIRR